MVEASTKGSVDRLDDLKSNVILGRLLPVGNEFRKRYLGVAGLESEIAHVAAETVVDEVADEEIIEDVVGSYTVE